jgi:hypothetical protein
MIVLSAGSRSSRITMRLFDLEQFRGKEIDTAGDGFLATFDGDVHRGRHIARA